MHRFRLLILTVSVLVVLALAGCGTKQVTITGANGQATTTTVKNIHFANTKFLLHAGLAFGAFHRYIEQPLKNGALRSGASHRIATLAKAGAAGLFIVHELKIAHEDAESSNQLRPLLVKIDNFESRLSGVIPSLRNGTAGTGALSTVSGAANSVSSTSNGLGVHIKDIAHAL